MDDREKRRIKILWLVSVLPFLIGIVMMSAAKTKTVYSTGSYWVAKDYSHVYEKYSGRIENKITEDETCKIEGDEIIVIKTNKGLHTAGFFITIFFGIFAGVVVFGTIGATDWWYRVKSAILCESE